MPKVAKTKGSSPLEEAAPQAMDFETSADLAVGSAENPVVDEDARDLVQPETDAAPLRAKFPPISAFEQNGKKSEFRRVCLLF